MPALRSALPPTLAVALAACAPVPGNGGLVADLLPPEERVFGNCEAMQMPDGTQEVVCFDGVYMIFPVLVSTRSPSGLTLGDEVAAIDAATAACVAGGYGGLSDTHEVTLVEEAGRPDALRVVGCN